MARIVFSYSMMPNFLWHSEWMRTMSPYSLFLYIYLFNKWQIAMERGTAEVDEAGESFITCTRQEAMEALCISRYEVTLTFKELEAVGFIRRNQQAGPYPDHIYVFLPQEGQEHSPCTGNTGNGLAPDGQQNSPYTGNSLAPTHYKKDRLIDNPSISLSNGDRGQKFSPQGHDGWMESYENTSFSIHLDTSGLSQENAERVARVADMLTDVCASGQRTVRIGHKARPVEEVRRRFQSLTADMILSVLDAVAQAQAMRRIQNPRGYLLAALYNAPTDATASFRDRSAEEIWGFAGPEEVARYARELMEMERREET